MNYQPRFAHHDRDFRSARSAFIRAKKLSDQYGVRLRSIARHVGDLVKGFEDNILARTVLVQTQLRKYADTLSPWAEATADRMIAEVAASDKQGWKRLSARIGRKLQQEIEQAPTGILMRQMKAEQVGLIKSIPLDAAQRVHDLTTEGIAKGRRSSEIAAEIMRTQEVSTARANLIARTEVGRTATALTAARAQHVGSTHFMWCTAGDSDVRPSHKKLNGQVFRWDEPPECDHGYHALPGAIFNCRCYPSVILPD